MLVTPTYPGVYVEEIPSGVRTITGVATSITAFIGRAKRGPCNEPTEINNLGDFERVFGGLWKDGDIPGGGVDTGNHLRLVHPYFAGTVFCYLRDVVIGQAVRRIVFFKMPALRRKTLNQLQSQRNPYISIVVYLQFRGVVARNAVGVALLVHEALNFARVFVNGIQPVFRPANPDLVAGIHGDAGQQVGGQAAWFRRIVFPLFKRRGNASPDIE